MKKLQDYLMIAFLALTPIIWSVSATDTRFFQEKFFQYAVMVLVASFCRNIWLFLFLAWALVLLGLNNFYPGQKEFFNIFLGIVLFSCSRSFFKKSSFLKFSLVLLAVCGLSIIWMVLQKFGVDPLFVNNPSHGDTQFREFTDLIGLFGSKSHNAIFIAICIPILASIRWYLAPILFIPLYFCESSAALAAGVLAYLIFLFIHHRKACLISIPILAIALSGYVFFKDIGTQGKFLTDRFPMWHATLKFSLARPIGYGPGSFFNVTPHKKFRFFKDDNRFVVGIYKGTVNGMEQYDAKEYNANFFKMHDGKDIETLSNPVGWNDPHNIFLSVLFEFGIIGLIVLCALIREVTARFIRSPKPIEVTVLFCILTVYLISSSTQFPMYVSRLACLAPIILGAFYARTEE